MDDQNLGETPEVELLSSLLVFLTLRAVPGVILAQLLLACVELQTLRQVDHLGVITVI